MKGTPETPQCGFSRASIQILGLQGVDPAKFSAFNVLEDAELRSGEYFHSSIYHAEVREAILDGTVVNGMLAAGIKEYSDWPTIPQLYVDKEFVGGCDILMSMHQNGELAKLLEDKGVLVPVESEEGAEIKNDGTS